MKKIKFVKIACAMLIMCLITTCAIGTTLAKYTTGSSAADTARVAKWGVEVSASGTLFGKAYQDVIVTDGLAAATVQSAGSVTINGAEYVKVVAPGTKNEVGMKLSIKGQPEVDYSITATYGLDFQEVKLAAGEYAVMVAEHGVNEGTIDWTNIYTYNSGAGTFEAATAYVAGKAYFRATNILNLAADYYPIVWNVFEQVNGSGSTIKNKVRLEEALIAMVNGYLGAGSTFDANTAIDRAYTLTWAWAFENGHDKEDTILGNIMAGNTETQMVAIKTTTGYMTNLSGKYNLTVGCSFEVGATQID